MKKKNGFTLIELLAVVVILGIMSAVATLAIVRAKKEQDEKNYKNQISTILTGAKKYMAENSEKMNFSGNRCDADKIANREKVACTTDDGIKISIAKLYEMGYIDIDNKVTGDLVYSNDDAIFNNSRSVTIEKCHDTMGLKIKYSLIDRRDPSSTTTYNDCGCAQQATGPGIKSQALCTD